MNTLKLRAFVRPYIPSIDKALIKHGYSTDIALFTQLLRKKIEQGEMCYQCALTMLKKYLSSIVLVLLQYCLGTDLVFISNTIFGLASGFFPVGSVPWSYHGMDSFGYCSALLREVAEGHPKRSRSRAEAHPNVSRSCPDAGPKKSRSAAEDKPKPSRRGVEISPSSDFVLTNFVPISAFYATDSGFSSGFHRATPIETRCRPDENPMKGRNSACVGQLTVDYTFGQETHKLDYSATLGSPFLSPCYTQGRLKDCTSHTQKNEAFLRSNDFELAGGVGLKRSVLSRFKLICEVKIYAIVTLVGSISRIAQRAFKCFSIVADYKPAYRMVLTCFFLMIFFQSSNYSFKVLKSIRALVLLALMVSMFSLSAQTPRKDSGVDGLSDLVALKPGDKIPDAVWNQSLELNYFNGKKKTIKFADLKGKLILLDFWSTGCPSCIEGIPKMEWIQQRFQDKLKVVMVNSKRNKDTAKRIRTRFEKFKADFNFTPSLPTVLVDTVFTALFAHNTLPALAVVDTNGAFVAMTSSHSLTDKNIQAVLDGKAVLKSEGNFKNLNRNAAEPLLDTLGVHYISAFGGYREHYLPVYPNLNYKNGTTFVQMGNQSLQFLLFQAYGQVLKGFRQNDLVIDAHLGRQFKEKLLNVNSAQNKYWYQFYTDDSISRRQFADIFCREFQNYFKIAVVHKRDSVELYKIQFSEKIKNIRTDGRASIARFQGIGEESFYQNIPIRLFLQNLFYAFDLPIELQEKENFNIDITVPAGFVRWTEQEKLSFLKEKGIVFTAVKEYRAYPFVYPIY